jgi:hypothetical protein
MSCHRNKIKSFFDFSDFPNGERWKAMVIEHLPVSDHSEQKIPNPITHHLNKIEK